MLSDGRTSMPATLPLRPWIGQVFTTFLALVSTTAMVLSPTRAATCADCAATVLSRMAAEAARMALKCMALSLWFAVARMRPRAGYGGGAGLDAERAIKIIVSRLHPSARQAR